MDWQVNYIEGNQTKCKHIFIQITLQKCMLMEMFFKDNCM